MIEQKQLAKIPNKIPHEIFSWVPKLPLSQQMAAYKVLMEPCVQKAPGSSHNHQNWEGGYLDHVLETMKLAENLYSAINIKDKLGHSRSVAFALDQALLVLFLHDLEKPWKIPKMTMTKQDCADLRMSKILEFEFILSDSQWKALKYVEGEGNDYSPKERVMSPLAAFCHCCDVISARIWFDQPEQPPNPFLPYYIIDPYV